ncbi:MAG: hypothetical protein KJ977_00005, partial [Candidatus Omnitrophica bacterium]|nr:hypothetical protein [Candidatus Omnitrophota bacterium]
DGISIFMGNVLNSYSRYFNIKHKRKGPLWQGRFRNALIANDEQLLHLTRYIHLNPVTAYLVDRPEQWFFSSYEEFTNNTEKLNKLCRYEDILDIHSKEYKKFVEGAISYQRELAQSKHLLFDDEG